jgi:hypothetical protein
MSSSDTPDHGRMTGVSVHSPARICATRKIVSRLIVTHEPRHFSHDLCHHLIIFLHHHSATLVGKPPRIGSLMILCRIFPRHKDCGAPDRCNFRHCAGASARNNDICCRIDIAHRLRTPHTEVSRIPPTTRDGDLAPQLAHVSVTRNMHNRHRMVEQIEHGRNGLVEDTTSQ